MSGIVLSLGLLLSGALGFLLGAKPSLIGRTLRSGSGPESGDARAVMDFLYPMAVAFFAGFVFSTLVPEALTHSTGTMISFATGIAAMWVLSTLVFKRDPCCEVGHDHRGFGAVSLLAMAVCSVNDGLLLGLLNPPGLSGLNLGMIIHKITSSFAIAQLLRQTRYRGAGLFAFGVAYTLISPASFLATRGKWLDVLPDTELLLAFSAGLLTYVILASLIPHARAIMIRRPRSIVGFGLAFIVSLSLGMWHTALHRGTGHGSHGKSEGASAPSVGGLPESPAAAIPGSTR